MFSQNVAQLFSTLIWFLIKLPFIIRYRQNKLTAPADDTESTIETRLVIAETVSIKCTMMKTFPTKSYFPLLYDFSKKLLLFIIRYWQNKVPGTCGRCRDPNRDPLGRRRDCFRRTYNYESFSYTISHQITIHHRTYKDENLFKPNLIFHSYTISHHQISTE